MTNPASGTTGSGSARDRYVDNARDGSKVVRKDDCAFEMDFSPSSLEEQYYRGGWDRANTPEGGTPLRADTSGMRGEPGIDDDVPSRLRRPMPYEDNYRDYGGRTPSGGSGD